LETSAAGLRDKDTKENSLKRSSQRSLGLGCEVTEFTHLGYAALALENDELRIVLLPGKGSDVIHFVYKPLEIDFMWASHPGLQHAGTVKTSTGPLSPFLDNYPGGWQEILPNFGDQCEYKNTTLRLHDEVSMLPWNYTIVEDEPQCVSVRLETRCVRTPFRIGKTLTLRPGCVLEVAEKLTNESAEMADCTWGHHPAFGAPFLDETCRVVVPPCRVRTQEEYVSPNSRIDKGQDCEWPIVRGRNGEKIDLSEVPDMTAHSPDMAYLYGFDRGWYALFNEGRKLGFGMSWDAKIFKYLWFWQVYGGWHGPPWHGTSYNIGLEPVSSYPPSLSGAIKSGSQLKLGPGESIETDLQVTVIPNLEEFVHHRSHGDLKAKKIPQS
jgi:Domain of unknown function (DUF4432)